MKEEALEFKKNSDLLANQASSYEDKILSVKNEVSRAYSSHSQEMNMMREKYEQQMRMMEINYKKEKQILIDNEIALRRQMETQIDRQLEEKREITRNYEDTIQKLQTGDLLIYIYMLI